MENIIPLKDGIPYVEVHSVLHQVCFDAPDQHLAAWLLQKIGEEPVTCKSAQQFIEACFGMWGRTSILKNLSWLVSQNYVTALSPLADNTPRYSVNVAVVQPLIDEIEARYKVDGILRQRKDTRGWVKGRSRK